MLGWGSAASVRCVTASWGVSCANTTSNSVVLEWDAIADAEYWYTGILTGSGYAARYSHQKLHASDVTSRTFTGLEKDTRYVMLLWWYNNNQWNKIAPPPECHTKPLDTPNITNHITGGNTLTIYWEPVEEAQRYQVQIAPVGTLGARGASANNDWETVISTGNVHTFTGLAPGARYTVRLRAVKSQNIFSANALVNRRTSPAWCKAVTTTNITLAWDDPNSDYEWRVSRIIGVNQYTDARTVAKGARTETTLTGLQPQTEYWFNVERRTTSSEQWRVYVPLPHCHTAPMSPTIVQCPQAADVDGTIRWTSNGAYQYRITQDSTRAKPAWITTNSTAHTFSSLAEGKTYNIAVQARNPQGWSPNSTCQMKTLPPIPNNLITGTGTYHFTAGTLKGVLHAAETATNTYATNNPNRWHTCKNTIDKTKLAAIMLSIPPSEAYSASTPSTAPSPMTLSRGDNLTHYWRTHQFTRDGKQLGEKKSLNIRLYSHMTVEGDRRAHWSPAVGLWQLDHLGEDIKLNHAERADIRKGGLVVAKFLLAEHCRNTSEYTQLKFVLNNRWHACNPNKKDVCYNRYIVNSDRIYSNGKLNIRKVDSATDGTLLNQVDGGIHERLCRWTSNKVPMKCYLYDPDKPQGFVINNAPNGGRIGSANPYTPYPSAFISFTDPNTSIKYAVWPSKWPSTAYSQEWPNAVVSSVKPIYRAVMPDEFVRCSPGRDKTPEPPKPKEPADDCAEETYKPFGNKIQNTDFTNGNQVVEGWFDNSVPYRAGGTESDKHRLQVKTCVLNLLDQSIRANCWWHDI